MKSKFGSFLYFLGKVQLWLNCAFIFLLLIFPTLELIRNIKNHGALSVFILIGIIFVSVVVISIFVKKQPIIIGSLFIAGGLIWIIMLFPDIGTGFTAELVVSVYFLNWVVNGLLFLGSGLLKHKERSMR